ncbi:MBL fold metallo-hydrolase [Methylocella sp.]|uniref:MBL fold metallo-hydrolase n=1 Tax=Methylocella sp. TaxID=1978226 RepID=UPI003782FFCF
MRPYYAGPPSDHFDGARFFTPGPVAARPASSFLRWRLSRAPATWPKFLPSPFRDAPPERVEGLRICLIGHASLLIQADRLNILVDPVFSMRVGPFGRFGPRRVNPPGVAFDDLPPVDAVLITHAHYDHLDLASLRRLQATHRPRFLVPLGVDEILRRGRVAGAEAHDWGARAALSGSVSARLTPARHWSARTPFDRNRSLWCGFLIEARAGKAYVAGDTGYGDGAFFRALRETHGAPDVAVLPIGAYAPRWFMAPQHVDPHEALAILEACGAAQGLGVHWGTFNLSDEGPDDPAVELAEALRAKGVAPERFLALRPGQAWTRDLSTR